MFGSKDIQKTSESIEEMKDAIIDKLAEIDTLKESIIRSMDKYDRELKSMSRTTRVCIGASLALSATNTVVLINILKKMK